MNAPSKALTSLLGEEVIKHPFTGHLLSGMLQGKGKEVFTAAHSSSPLQTSSTGQQNADLELMIPESGDKRSSSRRQQKKKAKAVVPVIPTTTLKIPSLSSTMMSHSMWYGELAPREYEFCPVQAVIKYPYRYLNKADSEAVSNAFYAAGQFRARGWSLYYIHTYIPSTKPLVLIPTVEFQALLEDIDNQLNIRLEIPSTPGFRIRFSDAGSPRARYLGQLTQDMDLSSWEQKIPDPNYKKHGENEVLDDRSFVAFKKKIEASIDVGKHKSKAAKEKRKNERVVQKKGWFAQLKRAQRYLGIRPCRTATESDDPLRTLDLPWDGLEKARKAYQLAVGIDLPDVDVTKPAQYNFELDVVFVSVDVEAYERERRAITEIGISSLDTRDLIKLAPGEGGADWFNKIRSRHFRIREYGHLQNTEFVAGCADRFEKAFGTSEWVSKAEAPKIIASCFRPPFAVNPKNPKANLRFVAVDHPQTGTSQPTDSAPSSSDAAQPDDTLLKRNIILVGHGIKSDIEYLRNLGYDVSNLSNLLEAIDTADIYRAFKQEQNPRNLGQVLLELGLTGWNLHNAGNDAAYTLQALLGIAFASLASKHTRQRNTLEAQTARLETATKEAQDRVEEDNEEWELAQGEGGDGGNAVGIPRRETDTLMKAGAYKAKSEKVVAREKAVRERKRAEEGAASRLLSSMADKFTSSNGVEGEKDGHVPENQQLAATYATTPGDLHDQEKNEKPTVGSEFPPLFTERMAYLDVDDDDGGVSLVYK